jgi:uncharacterized protein YbjT (DUF2867 family)
MLLVTGITGHSGSHFLQELIKNNYKEPIRCIVRHSSDTGLLDSSGLNIEKVFGDLNDPDILDKAMVGVDTVMHISSIFYSVAVLKAAIKNNVKKVILVIQPCLFKFRTASEDLRKLNEIDSIWKIANKIGYYLCLQGFMAH